MNLVGVFIKYKKEPYRLLLLYLPVIELTIPFAEIKPKWMSFYYVGQRAIYYLNIFLIEIYGLILIEILLNAYG